MASEDAAQVVFGSNLITVHDGIRCAMPEKPLGTTSDILYITVAYGRNLKIDLS
jgi:hypothetical protein